MLVGMAAVVGVGLGFGSAALVNRGAGEPTAAPNATSTPTDNASYDYYRSMMTGAYGGASMMGGSYAWMMGSSGYEWMMGGTQAPAWMTGSWLPGFMMGASADPGQVMGRFWANAPGARVSAADAARLATEAPAGASVDAGANRITFSGHVVHVAVVASPHAADERFEIAGLIDPTLVIPSGGVVTVEVINADSDSAHGLVVTGATQTPSAVPMMTAAPAFSGAALWFLGASTSAGLHEGTITFSADHAGSYTYLCPVPLHSQHGMMGTLIVGTGS